LEGVEKPTPLAPKTVILVRERANCGGAGELEESPSDRYQGAIEDTKVQ
jgi:hypothetical protein